MTAHCAACGYGPQWHAERDDAERARCPPETADKSGRRGVWKDAPPHDRATWREIMRRDALARTAAYAEAHAPYVAPVIAPPQVPARPAASAEEVASGHHTRARELGIYAAARSWSPAALYWRSGVGIEYSALLLRRHAERAAAVYVRVAGEWTADGSYYWRTDRRGSFCRPGVTALRKIINTPWESE